MFAELLKDLDDGLRGLQPPLVAEVSPKALVILPPDYRREVQAEGGYVVGDQMINPNDTYLVNTQVEEIGFEQDWAGGHPQTQERVAQERVSECSVEVIGPRESAGSFGGTSADRFDSLLDRIGRDLPEVLNSKRSALPGQNRVWWLAGVEKVRYGDADSRNTYRTVMLFHARDYPNERQ